MLFLFYFLIYFGEAEQGAQGERRESQAFSTPNAELDMELNPMTMRSWP